MTDVYPPFRLDQGGDDPGRLATRSVAGDVATSGGGAPQPGTPAAAGSAPPPPAHPWTAGRVVAAVVGSVLLTGALLTGIGAGAAAIAQGARNDDGFLMSPTRTYTTDTYALVTDGAEMTTDTSGDWALRELIGDARVTATAGSVPVFVGIAATADVDAYLGDASHAVISDPGASDRVTVTGSGALSAAPTTTDIWVAETTGTGTQELVWPVESGDWTVVVMNADASTGVDTSLAVGATVPALDWMVPALLVGTGLLVVLAIPCYVLAFRPARG